MKAYWEQLEAHRKLVGSPNETHEGPDNLTLVFLRKKEQLTPLQTPSLGDFLQLFGNSLDYVLVDVASGNDNNLKLDRAGFEKGLLKQWSDGLPANAECKLVVNIAKNRLLKEMFGDVQGKILLYFHSQEALKILAEDLVTIENEWFSPGEKLFLVLGDCDCNLVGDILHVFGGVAVDTIRTSVYEPLSDAQTEKLVKRLNTRAAQTHWQNGTRFLLPEYLKVKDRTVAEDPVFKPKINKHFLDLTIASMANYTRSESSGLVWLFEGQKRIEVGPIATVSVSDEVCDTWLEIYDWTYEDHTRDKLAIVRNLITLQPYSPETQNYGVITESAEPLKRSAKDHYDKFIGESIKEYFDKLKEATTYVQSKVAAVGQQVSGLVDTFTKNLLATAGFLLGTVLSKLIDPNLSRIYPLIVFAFVVYMAVILLVYYPLTWWSYHLTKKEYEHSLALYKRSFTQEDLETFIGTSFKSRQIHFWFAFLITALVHVSLLVTAYLAHSRGWLK